MAVDVPRHRAPAGTARLPDPGTPTFALSDLSPGTSGRIIRLLDDGVGGVLIRRLRNLGFVPGRIATPLRRHEARLIQVTTVEAENRIILHPRPAGRHAAADTAQAGGTL